MTKENKQEPNKASMADILHNKQHKELLFYLSIAIFFLELIVGGVAFFYGIIHAIPGENGGPPQFQFPWVVYGIAAIVAPAVLLLIVHMAGVGLFRSMHKRTPEEEEAWRANLPMRLQKVYTIIQGAPTIVLFLGIILLGVGLFYVDGAINALLDLAKFLAPYWPWIISGCFGTLCIIFVGKAYFAYRTRRMQEEYAFRREVFESTGQILVDKGTIPLPPAYYGDVSPMQALESGNRMQALPEKSIEIEDVEIIHKDDIIEIESVEEINMQNTIVLATRNAGKIRELTELLKNYNIQVLGLESFPHLEDVEETGKTFEENALLKAQYVAINTNYISLADDSGLEVDALGGAPGIYSARYANDLEFLENESKDERNIRKLLQELKNIDNRKARFICAMAACKPSGEHIIVRGAWEGTILHERRGTNGFGYDPVFFDEALGHSAAELSKEEKNTQSHRGKALKQFLSQWENFNAK